MNWVIVETNEYALIRSVEVIGPFADQHAAEMVRRDRHLGRLLESDWSAWNTKSVVRDVIQP